MLFWAALPLMVDYSSTAGGLDKDCFTCVLVDGQGRMASDLPCPGYGLVEGGWRSESVSSEAKALMTDDYFHASPR